VKNLTAGSGISFEKLHYITKDDHAEFIKRADPEYGDILLSKDGTLGVMRVVKTHQVFSIFVSVALIKPVVRNSSDFLGLVLSSPQVQVQMVPKGTGLVHIHLEDLREDCLPLAPTSEQIAILELTDEQVSVIDYLQSQISKKTIAVSNLRQAILQQAFSGKLVPQDQSDEPASSLVSRIAAARGANERAKLKSPTTKASKSKRRTT
jgi:type I restriction enzyme S subunit